MRDANIDRRYFIECAVTAGNNLFLIGWADDTKSPLSRITIETLDGTRRSYDIHGSDANGNCKRAPRPDVHKSLRLPPQTSYQLGFVIALPEHLIVGGERAIVSLEGFEQAAQIIAVADAAAVPRELDGLLIHSGYPLREMADSLDANRVVEWIDAAHRARRVRSQQLVSVEVALAVAGRSLLLIGWIAAPPEHITSVRVRMGRIDIDATAALVRVQRPELFEQFPQLAPVPLGFVMLLDYPEAAAVAEVSIDVVDRQGVQSVAVRLEVAGWAELLPQLKQCPALAEPLFAALDNSSALRSLPGYADDISWLRREAVAAITSTLPHSVSNPLTTIAAIDRVVSFADGGVLVMGWHHEPQARLSSVKLLNEDGSTIEVLRKLFGMPRRDVYEAMVRHYPRLAENCGFVLFGAAPSRAGEARAIGFELDNGCVEWLQLRSSETIRTGHQLLSALSASLGDVSKLDSTIFQFFDSGFGAMIERLSAPTPLQVDSVIEQQFGQPNAECDVSIVVPLYGRCDFLRYQLSHFADDPDFANADLIYVVDDPRIVTETLALAAHYESLFRIPFRVVHYGENRGFAGANNVGARHAKAPVLVLLNSDVLPTTHGWIGELKRELNRLPSAGAVGPLLLFADGSVQHAGMRALIDPALPGFIWNSHPGKGAPWRRGTEPVPQTLLTAACLMVRTDDYRELGGLDERYLVGDFEDSDFCLKLAQHGKTLWLVPAARLWHLERQSQGIGLIPTRRRLLTFYNGWRYKKRIDRGELPNPLVAAAATCAS